MDSVLAGRHQYAVPTVWRCMIFVIKSTPALLNWSIRWLFSLLHSTGVAHWWQPIYRAVLLSLFDRANMNYDGLTRCA